MRSSSRQLSVAGCSGASRPKSSTQLSRRDAPALVRTELRGVFGQQLLRQRPSRIRVREVVGPHDPLDVEVVLDVERGPVVLEGQPDVLEEVLRRQLLQLLGLVPKAMAFVDVVHPVGVVRRPPGVRLDANDLQVGMTVEDARKDQHAEDVLAATNDVQQRVDLGPAMAAVRAIGEDVEAERQLHVDRGRPETVVRRIVVVGFAGLPDIMTPLKPIFLISASSSTASAAFLTAA